MRNLEPWQGVAERRSSLPAVVRSLGGMPVTRTRAIVRRPSPSITDGEVTHIVRTPLDIEKAFAQHSAYVGLLASLGLTIVELPELPDHPDGVFVEDVLVMIDNFAVVTRPGAPTRRTEVDGLATFVASLGVRSGSIESPARVDGGDVLVTDRHVFVGQSSRTNMNAMKQIDRFCRTLRRHAVAITVDRCLHLKTAITCLPDGSLIAVRSWVDTTFFERLGYTVHLAFEDSGGDVLCVGNEVILPADAPETAAMIRGLGFDVHQIDVSELQKIEAGVTCLSVLI
jgi:dimethylargininase